MKLIRFGEAGKERPGIIKNEKWYDLSGFVKDYDEEFFANDGITNLKNVVKDKQLPEVDSRLLQIGLISSLIFCFKFNNCVFI